MAQIVAAFVECMRLLDHLSVSVIVRVYPREALQSLGLGSRWRRDLPAAVMVYYVIAMALFRTISARDVLRCRVDGLRWISSDLPVLVSGKSSISRARQGALHRSRRFATAARRRWRIPGCMAGGIGGCASWPLTARP